MNCQGFVTPCWENKVEHDDVWEVDILQWCKTLTQVWYISNFRLLILDKDAFTKLWDKGVTHTGWISLGDGTFGTPGY